MTKEYKIELTKDNKYDLKENVWSGFETIFEDLTSLLNFVIQNTWEKSQEGFSFLHAPQPELQLPPKEYDLIQRVSEAYITLERSLAQAEIININLKKTLNETQERLRQERQIILDLERRAK